MPLSSGNFRGKSTPSRRKRRQERGAFRVSDHTYPNGRKAYLVSGWIDGKRIRKFFLQPEDAQKACNELEIKRVADQNSESVVTTSLSSAQCRDAQVAIRLLEQAGRKKSLTHYVQIALDRYSEAESEISIQKAADGYISYKSREVEDLALSEEHFRKVRSEIENFVGYVGPKTRLTEVHSGDIQAWLEQFSIKPKTYNNKRGLVDAFLNFAIVEGWTEINPTKRIRKRRTRTGKGMATSLSPKEAEELMRYVESYNFNGRYKTGYMVPYISLCLFAGIRSCPRSGEISRLQPEHINLDTGVIHIFPDVSKTNERRSIPISSNLRVWLEAYPLEEFPIIPPRITVRKNDLKKKLGLAKNVMRHSYITYTVARDRSVGDAALRAGNTEAIVRKHYLDLRSEKEAEAFWRIYPNPR